MHPLALGESRTHFSDDCVRAGETTGQQLDQAIADLTAVVEGTPELHAQLLDLKRKVGAAAASAGHWDEVRKWADAAYAALRAHGLRLFDDDLGITAPSCARPMTAGAAGAERGADYWSAFRGGRR